MAELKGVYKLTDQCSVNFSLHNVVRDNTEMPLSPRAFATLCVLTEAALSARIATYNDFGNALWPETGWDDARKQALKDAIHDLRGAIGDIIRSKTSVGYTLTVTPEPQGTAICTCSSTAQTFGSTTAPYTAFMERVDRNSSRTAGLLEEYKLLSAELHSDKALGQVVQMHQARVRQYQAAPESVIDGTSYDLYKVTTGADISGFEQDIANLDYLTGEIRNALQALQAGAARLKRKMQAQDELGRSCVEAESLSAQESMAQFQSSSQMMDEASARIVESMERDVESCESILFSLKRSLSPAHIRIPHALQLRPEPLREVRRVLETSNHHLNSLQTSILSLLSLYESEDSYLELSGFAN